MNIIKGNMWNYPPKYFIVVPTNGIVNSNGKAVMGRGLALQTAQRYPDFPRKLARHLLTSGNTLGFFPEESIITFPVKHHWKEVADLKLIETSAQVLSGHVYSCFGALNASNILMPKVGCGNGQRDWETEVRPIIEKYLPNITIVDYA